MSYKDKRKEREYKRIHYQTNKEDYKRRSDEWKKNNPERVKELNKKSYEKHKYKQYERKMERKEEIKVWLSEYKSNLSCGVCGYNNPNALVFHHSNPEEKNYSVSNMVHHGISINRILEEIKKCEVLCANCHLIEHNHNS